MSSRKSSGKKPTGPSKTYRAAEKAYKKAMTLFVKKRDWAAARAAFEAFLEQYGAEPETIELADRARTHVDACNIREREVAGEPTTGAEWLLEGVVCGNEGRTDEALAAFDKALAGGAEAAAVHYSRAATLATAERFDEAIESLRLAIEQDPHARAYALGDPDFQRVRELAGFVALVEPPQQDTPDPEGIGHDQEGRPLYGTEDPFPG